MRRVRGKKRYGPARHRGLAPWRLDEIRRRRKREPKEVLYYLVPANKLVEIRKLTGGREWLHHVTWRDLVCHGALWENEQYVGLACQDWELKVEKSKVTTSKTRPETKGG